MKCNSCSEDVPAKFIKAIAENSCPICGGQIVDPEVKTTLNELALVLNKAKDYMDQIEEWLYTNYSLRKIKEDEVVINKNDIPTTVMDGERPHNKAGRGNPIKRAGGEEDGVSSTSGLDSKSAIDFIKKGGAGGLADPSLYVGTDDEGNQIDLAAEASNGLRRNELNQMNDLFGDGIQVDSKEDAQSNAYLQKLKRLQR